MPCTTFSTKQQEILVCVLFSENGHEVRDSGHDFLQSKYCTHEAVSKTITLPWTYKLTCLYLTL